MNALECMRTKSSLHRSRTELKTFERESSYDLVVSPPPRTKKGIIYRVGHKKRKNELSAQSVIDSFINYNNMRRALFVALLVQALSCGLHVDGFTSAPGAFMRRPRDVSPIKPQLLNTRSRVLGSKVDAIETQSEDRVISNADESGQGMKPPFTVTIEGDNQTYGKAVKRTLAWIGAASVFGGGLWALYGPEVGQEFFAGYLVEQSLSVDNLFVFLLLFEYFRVPQKYQDRVLNWGIFGAVVMRAIMIGIGSAALANFHEVLLVFAAILLFSSFAFFLGDNDEEDEDFSENTIVRFSKSLIPSTEKFDGDRFFTLMDGVRKATPLLICTIAVEISDVVFAVDSIPAVFGVTEVRVHSKGEKLCW